MKYLNATLDVTWTVKVKDIRDPMTDNLHSLLQSHNFLKLFWWSY